MTGMRRFTWQLPALAAALALAPVYVFRVLDWHKAYLPAARNLKTGADAYAPGLGFVYPPGSLLLPLPFSDWPPLASSLALYAFSVLAAFALGRAAWAASGGDAGAVRPAERLVLLAGVLGSLRFALDALGNQQTDLIVAALAVSGGACVLRAPGRGGALLGAAAALKATPLLLFVLPVLRWRWRALGAGVAVGLALTLAPELVSRPAGGGTWAWRWWESVIRPGLDGSRPPGAWATAPSLNHSLAGTLYRISNHDPAPLDRPRERPRLSAAALRAASRAAVFVLAGLSLAGLLAARRGPAESALELSLLLAAMPLLSPASSKPHFVVLLLPALVLARRAASGSRVAAVPLIGGLLALVLSWRGLLGGPGGAVAWWGGITAGALLLWLGCLLSLLRADQAGRGPASPHPPHGGRGS